MQQVATTDIVDGIGVITIDSPPVNALSTTVRRGLAAGFATLLHDDRVQAIVLICEGRTFFAGADISEFGKPAQLPTLHEILAVMENAAKHVIAAIHGSALGGGLETALICHHRVAVPSAKLGLPEVHLGLLPGGGGTQRLPRIVGVETALELMLSGRAISAGEAHDLGIVDALAREGQLREDAIAYARAVVALAAPLLRIRDRNDRIEEARAQSGLFAAFRARNATTLRGFKAPEHIVRAVEATLTLSFDEGMAREWALFRELEDSPESAAQRHIFFSERETAKIPDVPANTPTLPLAQAVIIGKGARSQAMAQFLEAAGLATTQFNDWQTAQRDVALSAADIIVEAFSGCSDITTDRLSSLEPLTKADVLLVPDDISNTDRWVAAFPERTNIVGLHIPPIGSGRLIEIIRGVRSSTQAIATLLRLVKKSGRIPVVSRLDEGSITGRLIAALDAKKNALSLQGVAHADMASALHDFGFPSPDREDADSHGQEDREDSLDRLLLPIVNEGARLLGEKAAIRASDIDMVAVLALGWPAYRGGPMFWADSIGLPAIVERLKRMDGAHGSTFVPAPYLETLAQEGRTFTRS